MSINQAHHCNYCYSRFPAVGMNKLDLSILGLHTSHAHHGIHIPGTDFLGWKTVLHPGKYYHGICNLPPYKNGLLRKIWNQIHTHINLTFRWNRLLPGHVAQQWPGFVSGLEHNTVGQTTGVHWTVPSWTQINVRNESVRLILPCSLEAFTPSTDANIPPQRKHSSTFSPGSGNSGMGCLGQWSPVHYCIVSGCKCMYHTLGSTHLMFEKVYKLLKASMLYASYQAKVK